MSTKYQAQIDRIKQKLVLLKDADPDLKAFGAKAHAYHINPPMKEADIQAFENQYQLTLPECYRAFLLQVGDKSAEIKDVSAGAYYGLYRLGYGTSDLVSENPEKYLKNACLLYPGMSDEAWDELTKNIDFGEITEGVDDNGDKVYFIDDVEDDCLDEIGKVFGGLLPLGTQGCTYYHALVLNGAHAGRVVNVDEDMQKPKFAYEDTFLDWYERYLDEVISGQLIEKRSGSFGYQRGEALEVLLAEYKQTDEAEKRAEIWEGIIYKATSFLVEYLDEIEQLIRLFPEDKSMLTQVLASVSYERAKPYMLELAETDLLSVVQFLHWYFDDKKPEWVEIVKAKLPQVSDEETIRYAVYTLMHKPTDYGEVIVPFVSNPDKEIRKSAFYALGQTLNKHKYLDAFITGLQDENNEVLAQALRSVNDIYDPRLLSCYQMIARRFPENVDYVLTGLRRNLEKYNMDIDRLLKMDF